MINHGRTLLLNIWAQSTQKQQAGYEYIPPEFRPLVLPTVLNTVRRVLFGSNPDQRFLNLRARELLSYIHQTPAVEYLYKLDKRVTYWPEPTATAFQFPTGIEVNQIRGPQRAAAFGGEFTANNSTGRAHRQYTIGFTGSDEVPIALEESRDRYLLIETDDRVLNELSADFMSLAADTVNEPRFKDKQLLNDKIPTIILPETNVRIKFADLPTDPETYDGRWYVKLTANPAPAITTLMPTLELLGEPMFIELFSLTDDEPYATFKNLWFDHPLPAYRLAGLVLAFIYRMESVRRHTNG